MRGKCTGASLKKNTSAAQRGSCFSREGPWQLIALAPRAGHQAKEVFGRVNGQLVKRQV